MTLFYCIAVKLPRVEMDGWVVKVSEFDRRDNWLFPVSYQHLSSVFLLYLEVFSFLHEAEGIERTDCCRTD